MTPAKKSPVQNAPASASKRPSATLSLADNSLAASASPPSVLAYQQLIEDHFADASEARVRYPRAVRVAIVVGGAIAAWAGVAMAARFTLGLFA